MNVLSLFDGMSCGQIALKELRIEPDIYYASEIDKFAIKQCKMLGNGWTVDVITHILSHMKLNEIE